ncbi:FAD-binding domain-containing protein [Bimuria novae-zelandiae CBS 107.79]|uniref:FAD-binding domain-containing protein n=1 Tax=Bimuria novae-zelandiae CBS 107.79 TaxID=1447943 RepID=A0A6A5VTT8_9PLEO|nr:FAD-binding domain-containing protein [Bimuria novae-zelandiae CBS 107.79]
MMGLVQFVSLCAFASAALALSTDGSFEPANFNITAALIANGISPEAIPDTQTLNERSSLGTCTVACRSLKTIFGSSRLLNQGSTGYTNFTGAYWSAQQNSVRPGCVFTPTKAVEVSTAVLISRLTQCPFAVKGGGHAAFAGSSSIEGGITIALQNFKRIEPSADGKTVDIGPGNRWLDVYQTLEPQGLNAVGGRIFSVGVPGLILGGGISFFSNKHGWACDNVESYELVTASGKILTVSYTSYPDLYWALRGGGNNFGVVTNFKLTAYPQGKMWGGGRVYTNASFSAALDAIYNFATTGSPTDPEAAQFISFGYEQGFGPLASAQLEYGKPIANAPVFADFNAIPSVQSTTAIQYQSNITITLNGGVPDGARETYWDASFKADRHLFTFLVDTFYALLPAVVDAAGLLPTISIQPITAGQLVGMQKNGGNALGLDPAGGPYFIMNMASMWTDPADDVRVLKFHADVLERVKVEAQKRGLDNDFIYQNYASQFQDVFSSYGKDNQKRLVAVSRKYDPKQVFQKLQPGYFKLEGGAPNPDML